MQARVWLGVGLAMVWGGVPLHPSGARACEQDGAAALAAAARLIDEGDEVGAEQELRAAWERHPGCGPQAVAFWATTGLRHARHAATRGGPPDLLAPVTEAIARLEVWRTRPGTVRHAEYAQGALRAAAAAAQDERPEMQIWITHLTELSSLLELAGEPPRWPLTASLVAGDLWYEVDRYADARDAYAQALDAAPTAYAHRGLARTLNRMGDVPGACRQYRAAEAWLESGHTSSPARREARAYIDSRACP